MKTFICALALVAILVAGCNTTPKKVAYNSLAAVGLTVDKASDALVTARIERKVKDADWDKAKEVQRRWFLAYNESCDLAAFDYTKAAPASLLKLQAEVLNTINLILQNP